MREHVYRLVIDTYPTPDGKPFTEQPANVWGLVGEPGAPDWMPSRDAMKPWERLEEDAPWSYFVPPDFTRHRRFLASSTARCWRDRAIAVGCTAHVETAVVGPYEPVRSRRRAEGGGTTQPATTHPE